MENAAFQGLIGLSLAMYLWLISAGLTIIFGVLKIVNFAHGSLFMVGAYLAYTFYGPAGLPFGVAVVLSLLGTGVLGLRDGARSSPGSTTSTRPTSCSSLSASSSSSTTRSRSSGAALFRIPPVPEFLEGSWPVFGRSFPVYNGFVIAVGLAVAVLLWAMFEKTWWGRIVRATAADREMASAIGINVPRVFSGRVRRSARCWPRWAAPSARRCAWPRRASARR